MSARTTRDKDLAKAASVGAEHYNAFADGCAHRDRQTVAWLRAIANQLAGAGRHSNAARLRWAADAIEQGEHVK